MTRGCSIYIPVSPWKVEDSSSEHEVNRQPLSHEAKVVKLWLSEPVIDQAQRKDSEHAWDQPKTHAIKSSSWVKVGGLC